jgi:ATP-dependent exoDNAse (exonuclease V) alpha subunit
MFKFAPPRAKAMSINRMQFPLVLCYALTNNKAQGQTLQRITIDQRNDSFAHGQTYVAFGRACNRDSVCVLVRPERAHSTGDQVSALVRNVVYPALLR